MKYIDNPPSIDELKSLYNSDIYQSLIKELEIAGIKFVQSEVDMRLINILSHAQKRTIHLNIPFEELESEFHKNADELLRFTKAKITFFEKISDKDIDGEIPKGEELGEENKSKIIEVLGYSKIILLYNIFELYLLKAGDSERLFNYLKASRMPYAKEYQGQLKKLYKQISNETI